MGFRCLCVSRHYSPIRLPKQEYGNTSAGRMGYTFQFFKPGTVKNNHNNDSDNESKKKKMHNQLDSQRHTINSIDDDIRQLTLKDWLLASPVIDKRTPNGEEGSNICSTKSSTIRIHPSPVQDQDHYISITSAKRFFMEMDSKYDGGGGGGGRGLTTPKEANNSAAEKKRRVQFKLPELADIISFDPTEEASQPRKRPTTQLRRRREGCRCSSNCLNLLV